MSAYDDPIGDTALECMGEMVRDELEAVVAAVGAKFPDRSRPEVEAVVRGAYRDLAHSAVITSHLIPLTLNRSTRMLRAAQDRDRRDGERLRLAAISGASSQNSG
ncbi:three-helix bundle dimerization domain-containing protein [Mycolicibacterium lacusdiani]|uniref:three-helix bundle dimerization domain-containing protein n=1 Tax=Mycolicibacterium lacusdiani TaxID=2895283 RepID=UPI001F1B4846|nr:hypothetical protein [Mycolicibacterium lacusdiani]